MAECSRARVVSMNVDGFFFEREEGEEGESADGQDFRGSRDGRVDLGVMEGRVSGTANRVSTLTPRTEDGRTPIIYDKARRTQANEFNAEGVEDTQP